MCAWFCRKCAWFQRRSARNWLKINHSLKSRPLGCRVHAWQLRHFAKRKITPWRNLVRHLFRCHRIEHSSPSLPLPKSQRLFSASLALSPCLRIHPRLGSISTPALSQEWMSHFGSACFKAAICRSRSFTPVQPLRASLCKLPKPWSPARSLTPVQPLR